MSPTLHGEGPARHSPEEPMTYIGTTHPQLNGKTCQVRCMLPNQFFAGRFVWAKFDDPATGYGNDWHMMLKAEFQ